MKKRKFKIACDWELCGIMTIKAHSLEEAVKIAEDSDDLPTDSDYIDGSFKINKEMTDHFYKEDYENEK